jgi:hypothetical protein
MCTRECITGADANGATSGESFEFGLLEELATRGALQGLPGGPDLGQENGLDEGAPVINMRAFSPGTRCNVMSFISSLLPRGERIQRDA